MRTKIKGKTDAVGRGSAISQNYSFLRKEFIGQAETAAECLSAEEGDCDGTRGTYGSDPARVERVTAQGGADGAGQVGAAFGPVQA